MLNAAQKEGKMYAYTTNMQRIIAIEREWMWFYRLGLSSLI